MANPTTNYGFVLPTSSDLVTDLPADFDVALQGVDTRLKALNPATTLGDLTYASATANTNTRLGIGSTGQVLTVSGGVPVWSAVSGGSMTVIASGSLSGSSVSLTSIPSTYIDLVLRLSAIDLNTDDKTIKITVNSATGATDYVRGLAFAGTMTSASGNPDLTVLSGIDDAVLTNFIDLQFPSYADTSTYQLINIRSFGADPTTTTSLVYVNNGMGVYRANTAVSSIQIFAADSTTFNGGSYVLYGVK